MRSTSNRLNASCGGSREENEEEAGKTLEILLFWLCGLECTSDGYDRRATQRKETGGTISLLIYPSLRHKLAISPHMDVNRVLWVTGESPRRRRTTWFFYVWSGFKSQIRVNFGWRIHGPWELKYQWSLAGSVRGVQFVMAFFFATSTASVLDGVRKWRSFAPATWFILLFLCLFHF